ncbi:MAG: hypothetical protein QMC90_01515, partial [Dehalococcoidales bacterium]|nr:hypothetical protein [Dehalococcoidales bacterium]
SRVIGTRDTFKYFCAQLPNFDLVPTWKTSTPHNIQLVTPQNQSCNSCHGQKELFLTEENLIPDDSEANKEVIVPQIPEKLE